MTLYDPDIFIRERRASDECGCPEIECDIFPFSVIVHLESDGTGDIFIDNGDEQNEKIGIECSGIDDLLMKAKKWVIELVETRGWDI